MIVEIESSINIRVDCRLKIAYLPFGSIEYHGGKLPYNTDSVIAGKLSSKCLKRYVDLRDTCIYVYPVVDLGYSHEWLKHPGTVSIDPGVYAEIVYSIIESIESNLKPNGYVFFNAHGGNYELLKIASKKLYRAYSKPFVLIDVWRIASMHGVEYCHACSFEAEIYKQLTGEAVEGVDETYCREKGLTGVYEEYKPGTCGEPDISPQDFIWEICGFLDKAISIIARMSGVSRA